MATFEQLYLEDLIRLFVRASHRLNQGNYDHSWRDFANQPQDQIRERINQKMLRVNSELSGEEYTRRMFWYWRVLATANGERSREDELKSLLRLFRPPRPASEMGQRPAAKRKLSQAMTTLERETWNRVRDLRGFGSSDQYGPYRSAMRTFPRSIYYFIGGNLSRSEQQDPVLRHWECKGILSGRGRGWLELDWSAGPDLTRGMFRSERNRLAEVRNAIETAIDTWNDGLSAMERWSLGYQSGPMIMELLDQAYGAMISRGISFGPGNPYRYHQYR